MFSFARRTRSAESENASLAEARRQQRQDITGAIGSTPVITLQNVKPRADCELMFKLEVLNPTGSVKDRPAVHIVNEAERTGQLGPGGTIIESTSGNFGISLAMIGAARGYRVIILVDPKTTRAKVRTLEAYGAEIVVVTEKDESGAYQKTRIRRANQMAGEIEGSFRPDQCSNPLNAEAHCLDTAREILEQTAGEIDLIVVAVSTGGQIAGIARHIREHCPRIQVIAVDVCGSTIFTDQPEPYFTPGMGMIWTPIQIRFEEIDAVHLVADEDAFAGARILARREGVLGGGSTGSVLQAMLHYGLKGSGIRILGLQADSGIGYLDTIYSDLWLEERGFRSDIGVDELVERARRAAPLHPDRMCYQDPDPDLVPPRWLAEAMQRRRGRDK